jgi:hypothetical protein
MTIKVDQEIHWPFSIVFSMPSSIFAYTWLKTCSPPPIKFGQIFAVRPAFPTFAIL